jgi:hypothetical protein
MIGVDQDHEAIGISDCIKLNSLNYFLRAAVQIFPIEIIFGTVFFSDFEGHAISVTQRNSLQSTCGDPKSKV